LQPATSNNFWHYSKSVLNEEHFFLVKALKIT
jgi:hypothetical protein